MVGTAPICSDCTWLRGPCCQCHTVLSFGPALHSLHARRPWTIVVLGEGINSACEKVGSRFRAEASGSAVSLVVLSPQAAHWTRSWCSFRSRTGPRPVPVVTAAPVGALSGTVARPLAGFVVADSLLTVVYGSRRMSDLGRVPSVLHLFRVATH